ncbi:TIM-barrel domain-containing protein [Winogradskyella tangerina]|uniref:TIM-barrel domain-containing protein n=1 Tax=Winogradskyella tangerina TaxID=2023240 RepID=UPI000DBE5EFB|nr:TIM-barrel domain-containing protein [Winogradskyella tangerina]
MKQTFLYIALLLVVSINAQNADRIYKSHNEEGGLFSVTTNDGRYEFQFFSKEILQTTFIPNGEDLDTDSHAVIMQPEKIKTSYKYKGKDISFGSDVLKVTITTEPFQIKYTYNGESIISEKRGYFKSAHEPMELVQGNIVADETEKIEFNITADEVLYGGGARALGMNRRGYRLPLFNRAHYGYQTHSELMNYTMPIVLSSKKYMIHFDNARIGYLDLDSKKNNTLTYETISGRKTYQIVVGDSWYDLINNYTDLTGKQPMLPRWALGNFSSRFGYHSQDETINTIKKFQDEEIPVDAIILDLYWFGKEIKGTMGNLEFFRDSFPDPDQMISDLRQKNVETVLITEPFILTTSKRWNEAVEKNILAKDSVGNPARYDFYFGNTGIVDIYKKEGFNWFKDIYKDLANKGVTGFWGDLGEPEVHPGWVQHETGSADEVHNIYGHDWARLVQEASLEAKPNLRPFILMRAGYSGSQRYGMVPWTGDVSRSWGGLQPQPEISLQMGMQGIAYMHSDLGGFAGANLDDELYARWLQYGVFQPIFRPHAQEDVPSEPVFRSEKAKKLAQDAIRLRYRMLPYNYNLMYENHKNGTPLMRPLFFEEPNNADLYEYSKTYLWGKDILVSPVLEAAKKEQDVYFPNGSHWYDLGNEKFFDGGQTATVNLDEDFIPVYFRAGAFIPFTAPNLVQSSKDYDDSRIQLFYVHHESVEESERAYYFDDGKTVNPVEKEQYQILEFEAEAKGRWLEIEFEAETAKNYNAETKTIDLIIFNIKNEPKRIKFGKEEIDGNYSKNDNVLTLNLTWDTSKETCVRIKLK